MIIKLRQFLKNKTQKKKLAGSKSVINDLWREIFKEKLYDFTASSDNPTILDIGANIGIASLYFKNKYPKAHIKAFEPVSESFKDLEINTKEFDSIELFNYGLSDHEGDGVIYGESDTAIESMTEIFRKTKKFTERELRPLSIKLRKLSSFIAGPIDFMKMDIEGSEGKVLQELEKSGKLKMIKEIFLEYHYNLVNKENDLGELICLLHRNNFHLNLRAKSEKDVYPVFIRAKSLNK